MPVRDVFSNPIGVWDFTKMAPTLVVPNIVQAGSDASPRTKGIVASVSYSAYPTLLDRGYTTSEMVRGVLLSGNATAFLLPTPINLPELVTVAAVYVREDANSTAVLANSSGHFFTVLQDGRWAVRNSGESYTSAAAGQPFPLTEYVGARVCILSVNRTTGEYNACVNGVPTSGTLAAVSIPNTFSQFGITEGGSESLGARRHYTLTGVWNSFNTPAQLLEASHSLLEDYKITTELSLAPDYQLSFAEPSLPKSSKEYLLDPVDLLRGFASYSCQAGFLRGFATMTGVTKVEGVPVSRLVVVLADTHYQRVGSVVSAPDGTFSISGLIPGRKYTAIAIPLDGDSHPPTCQTNITA